MSQLNVYVDKALASTLGDGKLSALNYASRLNDFVVAIFVTSLITVIYPKLSQFVNEKDITNFKKIMVKSSNCIILVVVPIVFGAILLAEPIVRVLLERGSFSHESTLMTSNALRFYAIGIIALELYLQKHPFSPDIVGGGLLYDNLIQGKYALSSDNKPKDLRIASVVERLLQVQPYMRPRTISQFRNLINTI